MPAPPTVNQIIPYPPPQPPGISRHYSEYLDRIAGMIGTPRSGLTSDELAQLNTYFNSNLRQCWLYGNWLDICANGEARFIGNSLVYPNDLTQGVIWSGTGLTITANTSYIGNPLDGRLNVCKMVETSAVTVRQVSQLYNALGSFATGTQYTFSAYVKIASGSRFFYLLADAGNGQAGAWFNLNTGVVASTSGAAALSVSGNIIPQAGGFYLCQLSFTTGTTIGTVPTAYIGMSLAASSLATYPGDLTSGLFVYGVVLQQQSNLSQTASFLPWVQAGESTIDTLYEVWANNPTQTRMPTRIGYQAVQGGAQLIGATTWNTGYLISGANTTFTSYGTPIQNPVYIYYRYAPSSLNGAAYSQTATYAVGDEIQYTNTTTGVIDYYTCIIATTPGQNPQTWPTAWSLNFIPDVFFQFAVYKSYADWLRADGQFDKAELQDTNAQDIVDNEYDTQEREMGVVAPLRVATHLTSR